MDHDVGVVIFRVDWNDFSLDHLLLLNRYYYWGWLYCNSWLLNLLFSLSGALVNNYGLGLLHNDGVWDILSRLGINDGFSLLLSYLVSTSDVVVLLHLRFKPKRLQHFMSDHLGLGIYHHNVLDWLWNFLSNNLLGDFHIHNLWFLRGDDLVLYPLHWLHLYILLYLNDSGFSLDHSLHNDGLCLHCYGLHLLLLVLQHIHFSVNDDGSVHNGDFWLNYSGFSYNLRLLVFNDLNNRFLVSSNDMSDSLTSFNLPIDSFCLGLSGYLFCNGCCGGRCGSCLPTFSWRGTFSLLGLLINDHLTCGLLTTCGWLGNGLLLWRVCDYNYILPCCGGVNLESGDCCFLE